MAMRRPSKRCTAAYTSPYLSINDAQLCMTASMVVWVGGRLIVLCADIG